MGIKLRTGKQVQGLLGDENNQTVLFNGGYSKFIKLKKAKFWLPGL